MIESLSHVPGTKRFFREIGHRQFQTQPHRGPPTKSAGRSSFIYHFLTFLFLKDNQSICWANTRSPIPSFKRRWLSGTRSQTACF